MDHMLRGLVLLVLSVSTANAQPEDAPADPTPLDPAPRAERFAFGLGLAVGVGDNEAYGAFVLEAGIAILDEPVRLRVRAFANLGNALMGQSDGGFARMGAGMEARLCSELGRLCGFADLDLGYQAFNISRANSRGVGGTRLGFEVGGEFRFRVALDVYREIVNADRPESFVGASLGLMIQP
jgi:hypothetical protein